MSQTYTLPRRAILDDDGALLHARWCVVEQVMIHEESFMYEPVEAHGEQLMEILDALYSDPHEAFPVWEGMVGMVEVDLLSNPFDNARMIDEEDMRTFAQETLNEADHPDLHYRLYSDPYELLGDDGIEALLQQRLEALWASGEHLSGARGAALQQQQAAPVVWFKEDGSVLIAGESRYAGQWRLEGDAVVVELPDWHSNPYALVAEDDWFILYENTFEAITRHILAPLEGAPALGEARVLPDDDARFGALRSCAQGEPDHERWWHACVQLEGWDVARLEEEILPYLERAVAGWPPRSRTIPPAWWARHLRGELEGAPLSVCDTWRPSEAWARSLYDVLAVRQAPLVEHVKALDLTGLSRWEDAVVWLGVLLHGPTWHELEQITLPFDTPYHERVQAAITGSAAMRGRRPPMITFT